MREINRFIQMLHGSFAKYKDINDPRCIAFGRKFKASLDVGKHDTRVELTREMRDDIVSREWLQDQAKRTLVHQI
jgi:hypothetical protein